MTKRLDLKLHAMATGQYKPTDFIIADAKDGDMAYGVLSAAPDENGNPQPKAAYLQAMREMTRSELVDIMLMSAGSAEQLIGEGLFAQSLVTPAVRMNDTTDIWVGRHATYRDEPSHPFSSADLESVKPFSDLGLYSMTFSNQLEPDLRSLNAYREFRLAARTHGFRHFLEVFNPAFDIGIAAAELGHYINDMIIKTLAGVTRSTHPQFLKIQFNGARAMSDLSAYDPERLIVGILGGASGTTRDTFELALQAEQAGARLALFGRKINLSEAPLELVRLLRDTVEQRCDTETAVRNYHHYLRDQSIAPQRSLDNDLQVTDPVLFRG
jgi:hypothetical protein